MSQCQKAVCRGQLSTTAAPSTIASCSSLISFSIVLSSLSGECIRSFYSILCVYSPLIYHLFTSLFCTLGDSTDLLFSSCAVAFSGISKPLLYLAIIQIFFFFPCTIVFFSSIKLMALSGTIESLP